MSLINLYLRAQWYGSIHNVSSRGEILWIRQQLQNLPRALIK